MTASLRLTGMPSARLAASRRIRCSPLEQGSSPASSAAMAAGQSMAAIVVVPSVMLVPWLMKRPVKSSRSRNVPFAMSRPTPASAG
ncbi:MAG TPA: hypothetical protein VE733_25940 [Streptosporangiaceae bacterium]|nr:hypothetical protein [Streptosporangiaceae bacterium]